MYVAVTASGRRYAFPAAAVVEVVPLVRFTPLPGAPPYVRGLFTYRGRVLPAVDLSVLTGGPGAPSLLSTRILVVEADDEDGGRRPVGVIAEGVTDTVAGSEGTLAQTGLSLPGAPWIEGVLATPHGLVACVRPSALVPREVTRMIREEPR